MFSSQIKDQQRNHKLHTTQYIIFSVIPNVSGQYIAWYLCIVPVKLVAKTIIRPIFKNIISASTQMCVSR